MSGCRRGPLSEGLYVLFGCIQALQCNENTCPTGITTHDPKLQKGLDPTVKADRVANYAISMQEEVELIAHSRGELDPQALSRRTPLSSTTRSAFTFSYAFVTVKPVSSSPQLRRISLAH